MKLNKLLILLSIFLILAISIGSISAADSSNYNSSDNNYGLSEVLSGNDKCDVQKSVNDNELISDSSKTITVVADKTNPNQVLNPTVQPVIDKNATDGDTIILKGDFVHCHFTIDKNLTVIGSQSSLDPCPHHKHEGVDDFGVFYVPKEGSGSVIKGFSFHNNDRSEYPFAVLVREASDVLISDCIIDFLNPNIDKMTGIIIENSNGVTLSNLLINNTIYGIRVINSANINIINCTFANTENYGVSVSGNSKNILIANNTIVNNGLSGINLTSANNVNIINNFIKNNGFVDDTESGSGIYVNTNITKLVVKGNIFSNNAVHAIMYDYRVRNLDNSEGADELTIVDNNYFAGGHSSMILHHRIYIPHEKGNMEYDASKDIFVDVGKGSYIEAKSYVYMRHAFVCDEEVVCGFTFYTPTIPWTLNAPGNNGLYDLSLTLSNISQIKKGIYQVSIVDNNGNIASDFGSFDVTFYLNNNSDIVDGNMGLSKTVKIQNGIAIVDFRDLADKYGETGSYITASFPGSFSLVKGNPYVQLFVDSLDIPGLVSPTRINIENTNIEHAEDKYIATLVDIYNKTLSDKPINVLIGEKSFNLVTNTNGQITLPILDCGRYNVVLSFEGDDDYFKSSAISEIVISKATPNLTFSQLTTYPISDDYFKVKLTDNKGKVVSNQNIAFKINGKTQTAKTDSNGIAKVKVSLTNTKIYGISISYGGNNYLKSILKTGKVVVKTGLKKSKITASNIKVKKNTKKSFSLKLTSSNGKAIAKQKVTVKLNGKTHTLKTNSKGEAKLSIKFNVAKKYKVTIKFLGNSNFKSTSKTCTITVTKK